MHELWEQDCAAFQAIVAALNNLMGTVQGWKGLSWSNKRFGISMGLMKGVQSKAAEYKSRFEECFRALDAARDESGALQPERGAPRSFVSCNKYRCFF